MVARGAECPLALRHALERGADRRTAVGIVVHEQELFWFGGFFWHELLIVAFSPERLQCHLGGRGDIPIEIGRGPREGLARSFPPQAPERFGRRLPNIAIP